MHLGVRYGHDKNAIIVKPPLTHNYTTKYHVSGRCVKLNSMWTQSAVIGIFPS